MDSSDPANSKPVPKRKGKMAKHRDAEKFRFSKNKVFDSEMVSKHLELRSLPTDVSAMFADLSYAPSLRPTVSIPVFLSILPRLLVLICGYLRDACKVVITDDELLSLAHVTMLQIQARVFRSRIGTPYPPDYSSEATVSRTVRVVRENIFPLSYYVQCIGKVLHENQAHIPVMNFHDTDFIDCFTKLGFPIAGISQNTIALGEGNPLFGSPIWIEFASDEAVRVARTRGILMENGFGFTQAYLTNPSGFDMAGLVRIGPPRSLLPSVELSVHRFHGLISKISRRVPQCLDKVDFDCEGHPAILSRCKDDDDAGIVEVWSDRFISDDALVLGAVLKFGLDPDGADDRLCVLAHVETTGALERYARLVQDRVQAS